MTDVRGHVWYSAASDETAVPLAAKLQYPCGRKAPSFSNCDILVNWGCRPRTEWSPKELDAGVTEGKLRILNHPIRANAARNKLNMLRRLSDSGIATPGFASLEEIASEAIEARVLSIRKEFGAGRLTWPLLGLNAVNRGQPAFCYNYDELTHALKGASSSEKPIDYVRSLTEGDEFRIHVFRDRVLAAQKKVMAGDPVATVAAALQKKVERQRGRAKEEGEKLVARSLKAEDVRELVGFLAEELLLGPTHYQRSIGRGCELQNVSTEQLSEETSKLAIRAVDALHLDMGAVHVIESGTGGQVRVRVVTNVITNPAANNKLLDLYAKAIEEFAGGKSGKKEIPGPTDDDKMRPELVAALHRRVDALSAEELRGLLGVLSSKE